MAEAAQRAAIEINLQIAGIEDLENVHNKVNSLVNDLPKLKESMNGLHMNLDFGEKAENQINELNTNLGRTNQILKEVHTDAQNIANPLRSDSEQAETLTSKFRTTKDTVNELTGNIKNAGNDTRQVGENARQIDEPFKQAVNILSEMSGDIKKVVDFQHQQTTAVKETNSSLRDVVGINEKIYSGQGRQTEAIKTTNVQIGQTRMAIGEISRAQESVTSDVKETESATSGWKDKLSGLKEKLNVKSAVDESNNSVKQFNSSSDETNKKVSKIKDTMIGTFAGNIISNGFNMMLGGFGEIIKAGQDYNREQDTMRTVWKALTTEAPQDGQHLVDYINDMAGKSIYASDTLDKMAQSFYHVHSNEQETKKWTDDFVALGSTLHMSNDALAESGEQFAKIVAGGKANSEDMQVMINRFPMFGEALQKVTGKSMQDLYKMSSQGKLTGQVFEQAIDSLGEKYKGGTAEAMTSFQGMSMYIKQRATTLAGDVENSAFKMTKSGSESMKELLSDDMMKKYAAGISDALGKATEVFVNMLKFVNQNKEAIMKMLGSIVKIGETLAGSIWQTVSSILTNIAKAFGLMGDNSKNSKSGIDNLADSLEAISKHERAIRLVGKAIVAAFAVKKLTQFTKAAKEVGESFSDIKSGANRAGGAINTLIHPVSSLRSGISKLKGTVNSLFNLAKTNPWILVLTTLATLAVVLYKTCKPFRELVNGIFKQLKEMFKGVINWIGETIKGTNGLGKGIREHKNLIKGLGAVILGVASAASVAFIAFKTWVGITKIATATATAFNFVLSANPIGLVVLGITALVAAVALAYAKIKPFRDFINGLGKMIVNVFKGVIDFFKNNWKQIGLFIMNPFAGIAAMLYKNVKPFRDFVNTVFGVIKSGFGAIGNFFSGFWSGTVKIFNAGIKLVTNVWNSGWNFIKNVVVGIFNGISSFFGGVWNGIKAIFSIGLNFISKLWELEWNGMKNIGVTIWNFITGFIGGFWNGIKSIWSGSLNWISKVWSDSWEGIFKFGKWIWDMISGTIGGFWNGIKNVWNSSIGWVSDVWNKGWTAIFDFGKGIWNGISNFIGGFWGGLKSIFKTAGDDISGIWNGTWQGVSDMFGSIWKGIKKIAQDGINGLIDVLNAGIDGIDWVVNKFGGPKEAIGKVKPVKFAAGTGGVTRDTLAMLNDGNDSPETGNKEMAILPNGKTFIPQKRNWTGVLPAGTEVLNAKETKMLMSMQGVTHFADGTGLWDKIVDTTKSVAGDVWGEIKDFGKDLQQGFDIATKIVSDPGKYLNDKFKSPDLKGDLMLNLGKGMFDKTKDAAGSFWNETWSAVGDILGSGGGSGSMGEFLSEAKRIGMGKPYVMGATGPDAFDCSGLVMKALQKFGINIGRTTVAMQTSSGVSGLGKDISKAKPGDLAIFGHGGGAAGHVGIVDNVNKHTMMNATPPKGTVSSIDDVTSVALDQYYHVKGLHSDDDADKKKSSSNAGVSGLVHKMFDNNMFKWIKDFLAPLGDNDGDSSATGPAPKGDHMNWLKQAGIPESWWGTTNEIIQKESGWDPHAKNPSGAYGLPQSLPGSKMASAGSDWRDNPITQLKWYKSYIQDRYGTIEKAIAFRRAHNWYENGGFIDHEQTATMGEGNKLEAIVPITKRNRAFEILRNIFSIMKPNKSEQEGLGLGNPNKNTSTMPGSDFYSPSTNTSSDNKDLSVGNSDKETLKELKKANQLNEQMFNAMLGLADLSKEQIIAIKGSEPSIDNINKQQGLKFNIDNYQHP